MRQSLSIYFINECESHNLEIIMLLINYLILINSGRTFQHSPFINEFALGVISNFNQVLYHSIGTDTVKTEGDRPVQFGFQGEKTVLFGTLGCHRVLKL